MEEQKNELENELSALQESVVFSQCDKVERRSMFLIWQNYVIMALMICVYFESSAISRLNSENDRLFQKNQEHAETKEAVLGFIFNAPYKLKSATRSNRLRPDGFPFSDWNPGLTTKVVMVAVKAGNMRSLEWVTRQPNWESVLSEEAVSAVRAAIENKHHETLPTESIAELKEELRIKTDEAAQLSECRAYLKNELSNAISREALLKELLWDSAKMLEGEKIIPIADRDLVDRDNKDLANSK
tara:strand:- start:2601 stop:3329 length:729 start_codon:yes stop_codon:yes gene_type:complete